MILIKCLHNEDKDNNVLHVGLCYSKLKMFENMTNSKQADESKTYEIETKLT